jgi:hypothetical protein
MHLIPRVSQISEGSFAKIESFLFCGHVIRILAKDFKIVEEIFFQKGRRLVGRCRPWPLFLQFPE